MAELRPGRRRQVQTMDEIVLNAERDAVQAGAAVMVVLQRAFVIMTVIIVLMAVRGRMISGMITAIVVLMGAHRMSGFVGCKHARVQPGKDAEDQEPCEKVTHACHLT